MKISGDAYIQVGGQRSAWKMTYADGTAHYQYTDPNEYSTDLKIDPVHFEFSDMTSDMCRMRKYQMEKLSLLYRVIR